MLRDKKYIRNMEANILNGVGKSGMVVFLFRDKVEVENEKKQAEEHTWDGVQSVQVPTAKIMFFCDVSSRIAASKEWFLPNFVAGQRELEMHVYRYAPCLQC